MLDENHSPDQWVFFCPVPELMWTWQSNATGILREWQFVDVTGYNVLRRCCVCPLRESNERSWLHGWPELSKGPCGLTSWWAGMSVGSQQYLAKEVSHFMKCYKKTKKKTNPHTHNHSCFPIQVSQCSSEGRRSLKIYKANYLIHVGSMEVVDLKHKLGSVNASLWHLHFSK